ncbi:hypothetical protein AB4Z48_19115 [Cupriavidus sp. 2TAF22]|uniref:hypothetical protein n=1 Tax=unclassified Cupriavidus TaxID=2640874 RepID=UPI003F8F82A9
MLRSIEELESYPVRATDADIGAVKDLLFDEQAWVVRYLRVEAGSKRSSQPVMVASKAIARSDWMDDVIHLTLARSQVLEHKQGEAADASLRSAQAMSHYGVHARDGDIGHMDSLLVDVHTWAMRYIIASISNWLLGDRVIIPVKAIQGVNWPDAMVSLDLTRETLKGAPRYDDEVRLDRRQEAGIHQYYGHPGYWLDPPAHDDASARRH